jgi:hypothetical protein
MSTSGPATGESEAVENALAARLAGGERYVVVGEGGELSAGLLARHPELFAPRDAAPVGAGVLALGLDEETLAAAGATARELGGHIVLVAVDRQDAGGSISEPEIRERVRHAGLVLAVLERLLWQQREGVAPDTRLRRIDQETRLALARCVLPDDPRSLSELERVISDLQCELDLQRQLQVEHAATREAERVREGRLQELEARLDHYGDRSLAPEVERLQAEIAAMHATRVWRLGNRWWELKRRLRPGSG